MWTDFTPPAADLAARADAGDQAAARQLLHMLAARTGDHDPLVAYFAGCAADWAYGAPEFSKSAAREAFRLEGRQQRAGADPKRVEALAAYRLLRQWGYRCIDARFDTADLFGVSDAWVKTLVEAPTEIEDISAELLVRLGCR